MSTTSTPTKPTAGSERTRRQLQELDSLLQQMLELPTAVKDEGQGASDKGQRQEPEPPPPAPEPLTQSPLTAESTTAVESPIKANVPPETVSTQSTPDHSLAATLDDASERREMSGDTPVCPTNTNPTPVPPNPRSTLLTPPAFKPVQETSVKKPTPIASLTSAKRPPLSSCKTGIKAALPLSHSHLQTIDQEAISATSDQPSAIRLDHTVAREPGTPMQPDSQVVSETTRMDPSHFVPPPVQENEDPRLGVSDQGSGIRSRDLGVRGQESAVETATVQTQSPPATTEATPAAQHSEPNTQEYDISADAPIDPIETGTFLDSAPGMLGETGHKIAMRYRWLIGINKAYDRSAFLFGPFGNILTAPLVKNLLGLAGLVMIGIALWIGFTNGWFESIIGKWK